MGGACCSANKIEESKKRANLGKKILPNKDKSEEADQVVNKDTQQPFEHSDSSDKNDEYQNAGQAALGDDFTLLPESDVKLQSEQWLFLDIATLPYRDLKLMPGIGQACVNGFINSGITCYMNVVFQAIINMPGIKEYFLGNIHQKEAIYNGKSQLNDTFVTRVAELIQIYHSYNDYVLEPTKLFDNISKNSDYFRSTGRQEDAHEFLTYAIERLATDLNR